MASSSVALRFRDATAGVDTIAEHRAILERDGSVWWGWWKKNFETGYIEYFRGLPQDIELEVLIVDRQTNRMFRAACSQWDVGSSERVDPSRVPEYYRPRIDYVFGWFLLTRIDDVQFDEKLARRFHERTVLLIDLHDIEPNEPRQIGGHEVKGSCLLHLSDLHFGNDYNFVPQDQKPQIGELRRTLTDSLCADLARIGVDKDIGAVAVTGDFTTAGDWSDKTKSQILNEFKALSVALGIDRTQILAVPGNHDIVRYPPNAGVDAAQMATNNQTEYKHEQDFRLFSEQLIGRRWSEPLNYIQRLHFPSVDVLFCILNSCTIVSTQWTEYGYVGTGGIDTISQLRDELVTRPTFKFLALHHHLLPVVGIQAPESKGVTISLDASELLDAAQQAGVHVAVHGHQHMPRLVKYETVNLSTTIKRQPLLVVSNGSAGVMEKRRPGSERNSYCVFRFSDKGIELWMRELRPDAKEGQTLFKGLLEISPADAK